MRQSFAHGLQKRGLDPCFDDFETQNGLGRKGVCECVCARRRTRAPHAGGDELYVTCDSRASALESLVPPPFTCQKLECWKVGCMKTTLDLPEDLVREMKLRAVHEGRKLRDVATEIFRRGLAQQSLQTAAATQPGVIQNRVKLPLIQCPSGTPKFNLTPEDIDRILSEQEMKRFNEACGH